MGKACVHRYSYEDASDPRLPRAHIIWKKREDAHDAAGTVWTAWTARWLDGSMARWLDGGVRNAVGGVGTRNGWVWATAMDSSSRRGAKRRRRRVEEIRALAEVDPCSHASVARAWTRAGPTRHQRPLITSTPDGGAWLPIALLHALHRHYGRHCRHGPQC